MIPFEPIILDLILIAILTFFAVIAAKKGFVTTVIRLFGWVIAAFLSFFLSSFLSRFIFNTFMRSSLTQKLSDKIGKMSGTQSLSAKLSTALEGMPKFFLNALGMEKGDPAANMANMANAGADQMAENLVNDMIGPTAILIMRILLFGLLFILCCVLVKLIAGVFKNLNKVPVVGSMNTVLGLVVGLLQGILVVSVVLVFLNLFTLLTGDQIPFFTKQNIEATKILKWFVYYNPFLS